MTHLDLRLADFVYDLPPEQIAQAPVTPRDQSRLMVLGPSAGQLAHHRFFELDQLLRSGDILVGNATRVFPARLRGRKKTGGKVEVLLLASEDAVWRALIRGATQPTDLVFAEDMHATMHRRLSNGEWEIKFSTNHVREFLEKHGEMPLPPYIKRGEKVAQDADRYQTVYAREEGAVAAPTAGFHFTPELLGRLKAKGIEWKEIILHVGWGTFRPIRSEKINEHQMLPETYRVAEEVARQLNAARAAGRRVIAIGTTVVRTLETVSDATGTYHSGEGQSDLFIAPGYRFKAIDALITNFHLPDSTPLLLANAFLASKHPKSPGFPFVLRKAYEEAIRQGYRFYSYGDAMLIQ